MNRITKQILISVLFLLALSSSFYWFSLLLFKEVEFLNPLIFFLISLLFVVAFFILLVLTFSSPFPRPSQENQKKEEEKDSYPAPPEKKVEAELEKQEQEDKKGKDKLKPTKTKSSFGWLILICFLAAVSFFLFFYFSTPQGNTTYLIVGTILFFLFLFFAGKAARDEERILLKFNFPRISKKGFGHFFTGFAILIAILLFLSPKILGGELILPRPLFDVIFPMIGNIFSLQLPGFSGDITVDEFLLLQAAETLEEFKKEKQHKTMIPFPFKEEKIEIELGLTEEEVREEILRQGREQISAMTGKKVKGNEKMKDIFYEMASSQISKVIEPYKQIGTVGLIFIFFFLLKSIFIIFSYICLPIAWLIFKLFKVTKFFKMEKVKIDKEVLTI